MNGMTSFARRQPAAFLGLSVLAGFAVVRFLKASADNGSSSQYGGAQSYGDSYGSSQSGGERRPS
jgi:hypothetical protein